MRTILLFILCFIQLITADAQQRYLIDNVNIVDVEKGLLRSGTSVMIENGVIKKVGKNISVTSNSTVINGNGLYLMPGLWDMHVHVTDTLENHFNWPLFVANGVTGVRDMGGNGIAALKRSKELIASKSLVAPRLYGAGNLLDGKPLVFTDQLPIQLTNELDVKRFVDSMVAGGADFIKAYEMLNKKTFTALLSYAKQKGKKVVGHLPATVNAEEAAMLGLHSMEHLRGLDYSVSSKKDSILQAQAFLIDTATGNGRTVRGRMIQSRQLATITTFDSTKALQVLNVLRKRKVYQTPTLVVGNYTWFVLQLDTTQAYRQQRRYMPPRRLKLWDSLYRIQPASNMDRLVLKDRFRMVKMMAEQNVPLLTGTDVHNPLLIPGYSLHQELVLLQMAGVPPPAILKAATFNAAESLGLEKTSGTVQQNKWADLLLLSANPLENVANTQKIEGVFLKGKYYSRSDL